MEQIPVKLNVNSPRPDHSLHCECQLQSGSLKHLIDIIFFYNKQKYFNEGIIIMLIKICFIKCFISKFSSSFLQVYSANLERVFIRMYYVCVRYLIQTNLPIANLIVHDLNNYMYIRRHFLLQSLQRSENLNAFGVSPIFVQSLYSCISI